LRKSFRILAIFVSLTLFSGIANAAVKAGSACSKLGSTSTYSGKKYTCIKSGKKLVWNKGVAIAKPVPVVTPTPSPTQSVTPTPTPTPTPSKAPAEPVVMDPCNKLGDTVDAKGVKLVCRLISGRQKAYLELSTKLVAAKNPKSPDQISVCRIPDARTGTKTHQTIAYPIQQDWVRDFSGIRKVAVVGLDFPDVPGTGNPLDIVKTDLEQAARFINWYSNGKVQLEFKTYDKWIRLSSDSEKYALGEHFTAAGGFTVQEMGQEFTKATKSKINIDGFNAIWYVTPTDISKIYEPFGLSGGSMAPSIYGINAKNYKLHTPAWTYFIHEMLHDLGLQGHSPKEPWVFGVLLNGNGLSSAMNSWDELIINWLAEDEIYCVDKNNLKSVELELAAIDRQQSGLHSVMIKLDQYRVLVIESHKPGEFSPGMPDAIYGLTFQLVDTRIDTTWNDNVATSVYLKVSREHEGFPQYGTPLPGGEESSATLWNGIGVVGALHGVDTNWLLFQGEKFNFEGIEIEFLKAGDVDTIKLSKTS
jgi:hypothetical protein